MEAKILRGMWKKNRSAEKRMMFAIALPIMIQRITHHLMLLIDRAFVGNLDARYLSAIGNVMIPYNAMTFVFFAIATGLTVLVAQNVGRKDYQRAQELSQSAFYLTLISTGLFLLWSLARKDLRFIRRHRRCSRFPWFTSGSYRYS